MDDILPQVGEFGKYQKLLMWLVCLPACLPCGFGAFNQLFMTETPPHWCKVPELQNLSMEMRRNLAIPKSNYAYSSCRRYAINWTKFLENNEELQPNISWPQEECVQGWEYNTTEIISSIVIDVSCDA